MGAGLAGVGVWARRDVRRGLARERISIALEPDAASRPVQTADDARRLAEFIRDQTLEGAGGRTYAETDPYLAADGTATADRSLALVDDRTGQPVPNPDYALWISSTTLQTALMQAYLAFRIAELTLGIGVAFVATGVGLAARR